MRLIEVIEDAVFVAVVLLAVHLVGFAIASYIFDKSLYFAITFVDPGIGVAPVVIEVVLHHAHLLGYCFFGIVLHTRVDGGDDF